MEIFGIVGGLFGWILWGIYNVIPNFSIAIILFTLVIKIILFPSTVKQQKSMAGNARVQGKVKELREKYKNDTRKQNEEIQKLYAKEGINPTGGCLNMILPLIILLGVFSSINSPLTNTLHLDSKKVSEAVVQMQKIPGSVSGGNSNYTEIELIKKFPQIQEADFIKETFSESERNDIMKFNSGFNFLGVDLLDTPNEKGLFSPLILIPLICFISYLGTQLLTQRINKTQMPQQGCMKVMLYGMPLFSAYFSYTVPAAVGFYWICSSLMGVLQTWVISKKYSAVLITAREEGSHIEMLKLEEAQVVYEYSPVNTNFEESSKQSSKQNKKKK